MAIYLNNNGTADRYDGAGSGGGSDFDLPYYETQAEADQAIEDHEIETGDYYAVGEEYPDTVISAEEVEYDNDESGLTATDVQGAIDELNGNLSDIVTITVSNTTALNSSFQTVNIVAKKIGKIVAVSIEGELKENLTSDWYFLSNTTDLPATILDFYTAFTNNFHSSNENTAINAILYISNSGSANPHQIMMRLNNYNSDLQIGRQIYASLYYITNE